ncbi:MAG: glycosyltransferase family 1 protein [Nitrospirota bacterium]
MKVVINALSARLGGGQTYLSNLLRFLPIDDRDEILIFATPSLKLPAERANIKRVSTSWPVENPFSRTIWESVYLPKLLLELKADVLFCPGGVVNSRPTTRCKIVTMFRNMIPFDLSQRKRYPLGYMRVRNWILQRSMLQSMKRADLVIFISKFARKVIEEHAPGCIKKAVIIPHGINSEFRVDDNCPLPRPSWLPKEDYFLYVSTLDFYKAQLEVVRGYAKLKQHRKIREKLILAGSENPLYGRKVRNEIAQLGLQNDVLITGAIPYNELPSVYQHAFINIFASESENCPNILLEALAARRPLIVSNRPPMPEFGGEAVLYFDPTSFNDLAHKLAFVLDNPACINELSFKAEKRALLYDWNITAQCTWDAIKGVA